jgi:hypothetical protein
MSISFIVAHVLAGAVNLKQFSNSRYNLFHASVAHQKQRKGPNSAPLHRKIFYMGIHLTETYICNYCLIHKFS